MRHRKPCAICGVEVYDVDPADDRELACSALGDCYFVQPSSRTDDRLFKRGGYSPQT